MHEILLILLLVAISTLPTGFFVKYDVTSKINVNNIDKKVTNNYKKSRKIKNLEEEAELDIDMFNELSDDVKEIIEKYL